MRNKASYQTQMSSSPKALRLPQRKLIKLRVQSITSSETDENSTPRFPSVKKTKLGTSLVVQRLRLCTPNQGVPSSILGQGTRSHMPQLKIPHASTKDPTCQQLESNNSLLYGPTLTSIRDYWKKQSFYHMDLCRQSDVSAF